MSLPLHNTQSNSSKRILPYRTTEIIDPTSSSSTSSIASSYSTLDSDSSGDAVVSRGQHQRANLDPFPLPSETHRGVSSPKLVPPVKPKPKPVPPVKPTKPHAGSLGNDRGVADRGVASYGGSGSPSNRPPALLPKPTKPKPSGVKPSRIGGARSKPGGDPLVISTVSTVSSPFAKTLEAKLSGNVMGGASSNMGGASSSVGGWDSRGKRPPMPPPKPRT